MNVEENITINTISINNDNNNNNNNNTNNNLESDFID